MLKIKNVMYDSTDIDGCETCNYGSEYIDTFTIVFEDGVELFVETTQEYEHAFSEGDLMRVLSDDDCQTVEDLENKLIDIYIANTYSFYDNKLIINGEEINLKSNNVNYINERVDK